VQHEQGKLLAAIGSYRKALSLNPRLAEPHLNLAQALETLGDVSSAIQESEAILQFDPGNAHVRVVLGRLLHAQGRGVDAEECFRRVIADKPDFVRARWCSTMSKLAVAYGPGERPEDSRRAFEQSFAELRKWFDEARPADGSVGVGSMQPYYLAYHECDNRALLSRYGDLCSSLMQPILGSRKLAPAMVRPRGKVRIGIVSGKIYDQSVWTAIVKGWCRHFDRRRFELTILSTGTIVDRETQLARSLVPDFVAGFKDVRQWADHILDRQFDVLFYPEIGMDGMSVRLASLRLAPVQAASWGHPETTGLPTIDYYFSADDFEPPGAQAWYREKLVKLPGLGCIYEPHEVPFDATSVDLSLDRSRVLLLCPGTPYKYNPRHDRVFLEIARRLPESRFVFCHDILQNVSAMVQRRFEAAFAMAGMKFDEHAVFVPHQSRVGFFGLMQVVDMCLDTIGFSGFNTAMQALECGLPVVGYEGRFMRGRFASGILRHMGLSELVAANEQQYVELVTKLACDVAYLQQLRIRIAEAAPGLFGDLSPLRVIEDFLESAVRDPR
jgi:predicted O-linked N-acetylglucosamine transferase (SPINDLY family)